MFFSLFHASLFSAHHSKSAIMRNLGQSIDIPISMDVPATTKMAQKGPTATRIPGIIRNHTEKWSYPERQHSLQVADEPIYRHRRKNKPYQSPYKYYLQGGGQAPNSVDVQTPGSTAFPDTSQHLRELHSVRIFRIARLLLDNQCYTPHFVEDLFSATELTGLISNHLDQQVLQKLAGNHNFTPFWANQYFREIQRKVKAPEILGLSPELQLCQNALDELMHPRHRTYNHWFLYPVDPIADGVPIYYDVVLQPMDLGTMRAKLENGEYATARNFREDFDLMIRNCKTFDQRGRACYAAGEELTRIFEGMWSNTESVAGRQRWSSMVSRYKQKINNWD